MRGPRQIKSTISAYAHSKGATRYIKLGFFSLFNQQQPEDSLQHSSGCIDHLAGYWIHAGRVPALRFGHVELRFSNNKVISITRSGGGVHYEQRVLSKSNYSTFFKIAVTELEEQKMERLAQEIYEQKPSFNLWGMLWNFAPFTSHCTVYRNNSYFCTELLLKLLQEGGIFLGVDPAKVSPNKLYDMCIQEKRAIITLNKVKMVK